ncbi:MAG: NADH-quinone oxidoreductase subunit F, partial [Acidimicrobiia bacterium]|nr:NADH-quinone oxidoreductase subunit F [Acidimicrobiia bacterium]
MTAILTSRMVAHPSDSNTIDRYQATGGYEALRKALAMTPEAVHQEVKLSEIRGRGGAFFPAGVKWGFLAPTQPRYLVINGDESEPG